MAAARGSGTGPGWLATLAGASILIVAGFGVGLVAGTAFEEPDLVLEHLAGNTTEVDLVELQPADAPSPAESKADRSEPSSPAPVAAPPPAFGGYEIQVGAFANADAARELAGELERLGLAVYIATDSDDGRFKVRVGPLATEDEAKRTAQRLKTQHSLPTWVLSRES